ncbi:DUF1801 domain-containing protein [Mucilaginibacter antarcticus]|uniref:DUF1801 domain-containing protein n=2 Tax=Mucilaginibacter antarcticus TaxID=1855725 RepID=A0ABW5XUT0_9SPHI
MSIYESGRLGQTLNCYFWLANVVLLKTLESYYLSKPEPYQSCLLALRDIVLSANSAIIHERKYQIPFFTYKGKKLGYLWLNGKKLMVAFCEDKSLQAVAPGIKAKDKYQSVRIDPNADIPVDWLLQTLSNYIALIDTTGN